MTSGPRTRLRLVGAASAATRPVGAASAAIRTPLRIVRAATLAALLLGAVSCGQTGPLTLPASTGDTPPADAADAEEDQTEEDER